MIVIAPVEQFTIFIYIALYIQSQPMQIKLNILTNLEIYFLIFLCIFTHYGQACKSFNAVKETTHIMFRQRDAIGSEVFSPT